MIKIKYLGMIAIASTTFLFSGCVHTTDTFEQQNSGQYTHSPYNNVSLASYAYPYYYDRPYYFLNGLYYYGGLYRNGFYNYGHRRFRHGHYYTHGHRYYNGRRYRARNGHHGYYTSRGHYQRSDHYNNSHMVKHRSEDRGRIYTANSKRSNIGNRRSNVRHSQSGGTVRTRHRPVRR